MSYRKSRIDLLLILDQVITTFATRLQDQRLSLNYDNAGLATLWIYADGDRLQQLFSNLLENSARYTDSGGKVNILLTAADGMVQIEIADSAPGVPTADYPRLFERLYRVEGSRSRSSGGSGLGLTICRNIVTAHQGTIRAQPSAFGGISVIIKLPLDSI